MSSTTSNEVKSWLKVALKNEHLKNFSVEILGNSEKGDGYVGDIVFVTVTGVQEDNTKKVYNLVLKCSKKSKAVRESAPIRETFLNEINWYQKSYVTFSQFQKEKGVKEPFNSVPKCFGVYVAENMEVLVLENLKSSGYTLWPKKLPLTRKHIDLVVNEYAKLHATSLAFKEQRPKDFQKLVDNIIDVFEDSLTDTDKENLFKKPIQEAHDLLKNDLDQNVLDEWKKLKDFDIFAEDNLKDIVRVIAHGDCWNNNFMFLHSENNSKVCLKVAFLDWQISRYVSPIYDLSYFLFSCIAKEDLEELDKILFSYHTTFLNQLNLLGVDKPDDLYSPSQFLKDWKRFSKYGIVMTSLLMKIVSTDKDEVVDFAQSVEGGKTFSEGFVNQIRDQENYKRRIQPIVEYVVKNDLI